MKNYLLTFLLSLLVVWAAVSVRRTVAGVGASSTHQAKLVAIGGEPTPPIPPAALATSAR